MEGITYTTDPLVSSQPPASRTLGTAINTTMMNSKEDDFPETPNSLNLPTPIVVSSLNINKGCLQKRLYPSVDRGSPVIKVIPKSNAAPPASRCTLSLTNVNNWDQDYNRDKEEHEEEIEELKALQHLVPDVSSSTNMSLSSVVQDYPPDPIIAGVLALKLELESVQMMKTQLQKEKEILTNDYNQRINRQLQRNISLNNEAKELRRKIKEETEKEENIKKEILTLKPVRGDKDEAFENIERVRDDATRKIAQIRYMTKSIELRQKQLILRLSSKEMERKKLLDELLRLKGTIRMFIRIVDQERNDYRERNKDYLNIDLPDRDTDMKLLELSSPKMKEMLFEAERVITPFDNEDVINKIINPIIQNTIDGYNCCIISTGASCDSIDSTSTLLLSQIVKNIETISKLRKEDGWNTIVNAKRKFLPLHEKMFVKEFETSEKTLMEGEYEDEEEEEKNNNNNTWKEERGMLLNEQGTRKGSTITVLNVKTENIIFKDYFSSKNPSSSSSFTSHSPKVNNNTIQVGHLYFISLSSEILDKQLVYELNYLFNVKANHSINKTENEEKNPVVYRNALSLMIDSLIPQNTKFLVISSISTREPLSSNSSSHPFPSAVLNMKLTTKLSDSSLSSSPSSPYPMSPIHPLHQQKI